MSVSPETVASLWSTYSTRIPTKFAIGLAERESGFDDQEVDDYQSGKRVTPVRGDKYTVGLFQVSESELHEIDGDDGTWYVDKLRDVDTNVRVFAAYMEKRLTSIAKLVDAREPDVWAYLALCHNAGLGMVQKTIKLYGMDWEDFKRRNAETDQGRRWARYGDAAINGGSKWSDAFSDLADEAATVLDRFDPDVLVAVALALGGLAYYAIRGGGI